MFQNWANYFLGTNNETTTVEGTVTTNNLRLTTSSSEDDWVLVERDSEGNSEISSVESLDFDVEDENEKDNFLIKLPLQATALLKRTNSTTSLPCSTSNNNLMDESWFVTPPPCFISTGPVHMETSPMENLLIEHPSMSVYTHHGRRHNLPIRNTSPELENEIDEEEEEEIEEELVVVRRARINRMQILQQQERQGIKSKQAQKVQIHKACQSMKRGNLERNNKAREVNSRNRRQRRGERSQGATRSHANNNRKCC